MRRWRPRLEPARGIFTPAAGDYYVVVDDIESGRAVLVLSPWPEVDASGHLVFEGDDLTRDVPLDEFQVVVNRERRAAGQPADSRDVRVGDVFAVRADGVDAMDAPVVQWRVVDVTRPARKAAHAALLTAANPELRTDAPSDTPTDAGAGDVAPATDDEPLEPPASGAAAPAV